MCGRAAIARGACNVCASCFRKRTTPTKWGGICLSCIYLAPPRGRGCHPRCLSLPTFVLSLQWPGTAAVGQECVSTWLTSAGVAQLARRWSHNLCWGVQSPPLGTPPASAGCEVYKWSLKGRDGCFPGCSPTCSVVCHHVHPQLFSSLWYVGRVRSAERGLLWLLLCVPPVQCWNCLRALATR